MWEFVHVFRRVKGLVRFICNPVARSRTFMKTFTSLPMRSQRHSSTMILAEVNRV